MMEIDEKQNPTDINNIKQMDLVFFQLKALINDYIINLKDKQSIKMNDLNSALISNDFATMRVINANTVTIKHVRGFQWLKNENISIKNLKPAALIQQKIFIYNSVPHQTYPTTTVQ